MENLILMTQIFYTGLHAVIDMVHIPGYITVSNFLFCIKHIDHNSLQNFTSDKRKPECRLTFSLCHHKKLYCIILKHLQCSSFVRMFYCEI